jgi:hypothetical protein
MSRRKRFTRNLGRTLGSPLPVRTTDEWVRFEHERAPYGLFSCLSAAEKGLGSGLRAELRVLSHWFNEHLDVPDLATLERFWFKAEAREYVERARRLAALVRRTGIPMVERRACRVPGKVCWEDEHQVAVLTYRDAPQPARRARADAR